MSKWFNLQWEKKKKISREKQTRTSSLNSKESMRIRSEGRFFRSHRVTAEWETRFSFWFVEIQGGAHLSSGGNLRPFTRQLWQNGPEVEENHGSGMSHCGRNAKAAIEFLTFSLFGVLLVHSSTLNGRKNRCVLRVCPAFSSTTVVMLKIHYCLFRAAVELFRGQHLELIRVCFTITHEHCLSTKWRTLRLNSTGRLSRKKRRKWIRGWRRGL
jgi:hypothetical protein